MEHSPSIENWLGLIRAQEVGPVIFGRLVGHFGSVERALGASAVELARVEGIGQKTAERIVSTRNKFNVEKELALADRLGVWIINWDDPRYPLVLKAIYDPPPVLYVRGTLLRQDSLSIAIVGARRCSAYGSEQSARFAHLLAASGFTIVSGLARGIDSAAHKGALSAAGRTIAVQACGLATVFPPENEPLAKLISENGAIISELPLDTMPRGENFPTRNRIIAGLAMAVLVVEASARSGAMITARAALENNREVLAIPGKIDSPLSEGSHNLIKNGATLVTGIQDIVEALGCVGRGLQQHIDTSVETAREKTQKNLFDTSMLNLDSTQKTVLEFLDFEPLHLEEIIEKSALAPGQVSAALINLRLMGLIKHLPGDMFLRT